MTPDLLDDLPPTWRLPVMEGAVTLREAHELVMLLEPGQWVETPPALRDAVSQLLLWQMPAEPTVH
jgi:hypothetical protein